MKLQLNATGAWRNVIDFDERNREGIQADARALALCSRGKPPKLRIITDQGEPLYECDGQDYRWRAWEAR